MSKAKSKTTEQPIKLRQYPFTILPIASIEPYEKNPRFHSTAQIEQLRASIREFGFTNPILVDDRHRLIAGHGRLIAAQDEGFTELPAIVIDGLNDMQRRALIIADNKLAENASWDDLTLSQELSEILASGFDLKIAGYEQGELDRLLSAFVPDAEQPTLDTPPQITCPKCGATFDRT